MPHTQKVAITMPEFLVKEIDTLSQRKGLSRSRYITLAITEKVEDEKKRFITEAYNEIFSNKNIQREQFETSTSFEKVGSEGGQEW